jgi:hypothetical protein
MAKAETRTSSISAEQRAALTGFYNRNRGSAWQLPGYYVKTGVAALVLGGTLFGGLVQSFGTEKPTTSNAAGGGPTASAPEVIPTDGAVPEQPAPETTGSGNASAVNCDLQSLVPAEAPAGSKRVILGVEINGDQPKEDTSFEGYVYDKEDKAIVPGVGATVLSQPDGSVSAEFSDNSTPEQVYVVYAGTFAGRALCGGFSMEGDVPKFYVGELPESP